MTGSVPDRWLEVRVFIQGELNRCLAAELLVEQGARGVQELADHLVTWFPPPSDPPGFVRKLSALLAEEGAEPVQAVEWGWQSQVEWADYWRRGLGPRRVGERIVIRPSWTPYESRPGDLVITLDPGMAFGTGEHATTRGALRLIENRVLPGQRVADVGTGSGILAVAMALLGAGVDAFDVDPLACEVARQNAEANGVAGPVRVQEGSLEGRRGAYAGVVANLEWLKLRPLLGPVVEATARDGWVVLAGILSGQREEASALASDLGLVLDGQDLEAEWWAAAFRRPGSKTGRRPAAP